MNTCPYTNENEICRLPSREYPGTTAYCDKCSQFAFQCADGHWNRAFARYCTQCSKELKKPTIWGMASGNPQRTTTLSKDPAETDLRLNSGVVNNIPKIESGENLPGILIIDGFFILPNPDENRLEICTIENVKDRIKLKKKWMINFHNPLTFASTPVHHGLHLYSVATGGIQKTSMLDGKTELINKIDGIPETQIEPLPGCAPLKCEVYGRPFLIAGVKNGYLLFDFANDSGQYKQHTFFDEEREPLSPTLCGTYIVFTTKRGSVLSLNIDTNPFERKRLTTENRSFSSPVSVGGLVYFEVLNDNGARSLACFEPIKGQLSKAADMDTESIQNLDMRLNLFIHPPLTNGKRLYLSDRSGYVAYIYDSNHGTLPDRTLPNRADKHRFVPHQSTFMNNRIYSAHSSGLTVWSLDSNSPVQTHPLSMGNRTAPIPVARPVRYGGKLYILCQDRFICRDYQEDKCL